MKVKDIMTTAVKSCGPDTDLAAAAMLMWDGDCGILPIIDADQKVKGVLTDRDICMAVGSKHRKAEEITAQEMLNGALYTCKPGDDVRTALNTMARHQVRRLPVLNSGGRLQGVLSLNDLALMAQNGKGRKKSELSYEDVMHTIQAVCQHRNLPAQRRQVA